MTTLTTTNETEGVTKRYRVTIEIAEFDVIINQSSYGPWEDLVFQREIGESELLAEFDDMNKAIEFAGKVLSSHGE